MMELILMRHGKAEDRGLRDNDDDRELTPKGRLIVGEVAQGLIKLLDDKKRLHVWSSPLPRALETAKIVAATLNGTEVVIHEAIAWGQLDNLARGWQNMTAGDTVLVIGHQPFLGAWSARIADVIIPFKPAGAVGFKMESWLPPEGKLRWCAQASVLADLGKYQAITWRD